MASPKATLERSLPEAFLSCKLFSFDHPEVVSLARSMFGRLREATGTAALPQLVRAEDPDRDVVNEMMGYGGADDGVEVDDCPDCENGRMADGTLCATCDGNGWVPPSDGMREAVLDAAARKRIPKADFAVPSMAPGSGSYPIADREHAINALARSSGKPEEATVKAAVYAKYPDLKPGGATAESQEVLQEQMRRIGLQLSKLREGTVFSLDRQDTPLKTVTTKDGREGYAVVLIREGLGNTEDNRWYTRDGIKELCESGRAEGMQAYANHPPIDGDGGSADGLPERDVKQLVGTYADVTFAESKGRARADAILVPINGPGYDWVQTLAEAAASHTGPKPLCGISLYGGCAGDYGNRPDGSFGELATRIFPTSADIVTNAGAGGEFQRRLMESARQRRRNSIKKESRMTLDELKAKMRESAKLVREADTDEKRTAALAELDELATVEVEDAAVVPATLEGLQESQPQLVAALRESAKQEVAGELVTVQSQLREAQKLNQETATTLETLSVLRERKITDPSEVKFYVDEVVARGLRESAAITAFIDGQIARETRIRESTLAAVQGAGVEGNGGRVPAAGEQGGGGIEKLREAGIPIMTVAAA